MKKKYLLLILVSLFLVTGCGKKVYTCEKNLLDYNGMKIDRKVELTYNNKKIAKEVITVKYKTNSPKEHKKALEILHKCNFVCSDQKLSIPRNCPPFSHTW